MPLRVIDELVRTASRGDPAALDALLAAVRPEVLRLCGRLLPHREDAEEACQDALLAVARGITRFEGRSSFHTWLYGVTANRARSTYRALRRRWLSRAVRLRDEPPIPAAPAWSPAPGWTSDALDAVPPTWPRWWSCGKCWVWAPRDRRTPDLPKGP